MYLKLVSRNDFSDRVIDFSTSEVFGTHAYRSTEKDQAISGSAGEARWTYAVSKLAGEHLAKAYNSQYKASLSLLFDHLMFMDLAKLVREQFRSL